LSEKLEKRAGELRQLQHTSLAWVARREAELAEHAASLEAREERLSRRQQHPAPEYTVQSDESDGVELSAL
jgi:hypothetical protein